SGVPCVKGPCRYSWSPAPHAPASCPSRKYVAPASLAPGPSSSAGIRRAAIASMARACCALKNFSVRAVLAAASRCGPASAFASAADVRAAHAAPGTPTVRAFSTLRRPARGSCSIVMSPVDGREAPGLRCERVSKFSARHAACRYPCAYDQQPEPDMNLRILSLLHGGLLCGGLAISACAAAGHADGQGADAAAPRDRHRESAPALQTPQQKVQEDPARREDSNARPG